MVIGNLPDEQLKSYVTLINKKYYFEDPIKAIEACFHLYYALDLTYPVECVNVWTFLQVYIFGVPLQSNNKNKPTLSSVNTVNNNLLNII